MNKLKIIPELTWNKEAKAIYVKVRNSKVFRTNVLEPHGIEGVMITADQDKKGRLVGVEIVL